VSTRQEISAIRQDLRRRGFEGAVAGPADDGFDQVRLVWNGYIDRRPSLIVQCRRESDVSVALGFLGPRVSTISVRGGGHSVAGTAVADDVPMIDLSHVRGCSVSQDVVAAQGGSRLRDLDEATLARGRLCPSGVVSRTGLGGLALGGGYGWFSRTLGLTCDQIQRATIVLASGETLIVDADSHPDLLWALRGGGGNFGIVTRFELRHHPAPSGHLHTLRAQGAALAAILRACGEHLNSRTPRELTVRLALGAAETGGAAQAKMQALWLSSQGTTPAWLSRLNEQPGIAATQHPVTASAIQRMMDDVEPDGLRYYTSSRNVSTMADDALRDTLTILAAGAPSLMSSLDITHLGGAIEDAGAECSAFPRRDAPFLVSASACWHHHAQDEANIQWARSLHELVRPWSVGGNYINYMAQERLSDVKEVYGADRYARLARIKAVYDPQNVFSHNQNIAPPLPRKGNRDPIVRAYASRCEPARTSRPQDDVA
jgi:hypothetical protein